MIYDPLLFSSFGVFSSFLFELEQTLLYRNPNLRKLSTFPSRRILMPLVSIQFPFRGVIPIQLSEHLSFARYVIRRNEMRSGRTRALTVSTRGWQ